MGVDISVIWFAIIVFATLMYIIGMALIGHRPAAVPSWAMPRSAM